MTASEVTTLLITLVTSFLTLYLQYINIEQGKQEMVHKNLKKIALKIILLFDAAIASYCIVTITLKDSISGLDALIMAISVSFFLFLFVINAFSRVIDALKTSLELMTGTHEVQKLQTEILHELTGSKQKQIQENTKRN